MIAVIEADSPAPTSNNCSLACSEEEVGRFVGSGRRGRRRRGRARVGSVSSRAPQIFPPTKLCQFLHTCICPCHLANDEEGIGFATRQCLTQVGLPISQIFSVHVHCMCIFVHLSEISVQETNPHLCLKKYRVDVAHRTTRMRSHETPTQLPKCISRGYCLPST